MSSKKKSALVPALVGVFALVMSLPVSNLFIQRTSLASAGDPEFKHVSDLLISKCSDCHTRDLAEYPLYFSIPGANSIINRNVENGRAAFLMTKEKLAGRERFSIGDVNRLSQAMLRGDMPPLPYRVLHWNSTLTAKEQKLLVSWIQKREKEFDIRAIPATNFFNPDARKVELGRWLFVDKRLSTNNSTSCASCHKLDQGGTSNSSAETVRLKLRLNTPTVYNAAYNFVQYWDGRAPDLAAQAYNAVTNPNELNSNWPQVVARLQRDPKLVMSFKGCYEEGLDVRTICDAIAQYEMTLLTPGCRFDRLLNGDRSALNNDEEDGYELFLKHECFTCHSGPALGGQSFEKMGKRKEYFTKSVASYIDGGRANVTHREEDLHKFKVPTLRNIELTAPYFHDGSAQSLNDAVKTMSEFQGNPLTDEERSKVVAFLRTLTAPGAKSVH